jgi:cell division protein FtsI (penicillin-binding protein 3)
MEVKKDISWRVYLSFIALTLFGILILGKAFYTQKFEGNYWKKMGDSLHTKIIDLDAERGTIYSEDGSMLSTSLPEFDIYIDFGAEGLRKNNGEIFYEKIDSLSDSLSNLFADKTAVYYKKELIGAYASKNRYYAFRKKVSFEEYKRLRKFPLIKEGKNKSGFIVDVKTKRLNPFGELGFRTIGLYREHGKLVGLERSFDSVLRGAAGKRLVRFAAGGMMMPVEGFELSPENGQDIYTTLDVNIQDIAERALMKKMVANQALEGTCVVMEVATGKIKAMANLGRTKEGNYFEIDNYALKTSEPGSTIKLVTLLAALEDKHITIKDSIFINGGNWNISGRKVEDDHDGPASVSFKHAFAHSSNVAMSKLAFQHYTKSPISYYKHLERLRLTGKSGIELKEEFFPGIKNPSKEKYWHPTTLISWGFGYELQVSPIQLLMVYNAVANNGKMMKPYLLNEIRQYGTVVYKNEPAILESAIASPFTIQQLKECLEATCTEGTAKDVFKTTPYKAAGKTGTAKVNDGFFKYEDKVYQSAFAGYFPADRPVYSMIVVIKNAPKTVNIYGSSVAAPVFKEIADHLYKYTQPQSIVFNSSIADSMNVAFKQQKSTVGKIADSPKAPTTESVFSVEKNKADFDADRMIAIRKQSRTVIPDVTGMGLKDALHLLESHGLKVIINGKGKVVSQSLAKGMTLPKNEPIVLYLN